MAIRISNKIKILKKTRKTGKSREAKDPNASI
jgi:hypothetical protein